MTALSSIENLFQLSWRVSSLPRAVKFPKNEMMALSQRQWLLLEDVARQLASACPFYPQLTNIDEGRVRPLVDELTPHIPNLHKYLDALEKERTPPSHNFKKIGTYDRFDFLK